MFENVQLCLKTYKTPAHCVEVEGGTWRFHRFFALMPTPVWKRPV